MNKVSGKFVLRIPSNLHQQLQRLSTSKGISLNQICLEALLAHYSKNRSSHNLLNHWAIDSLDLLKSIGLPVLGVLQFGSTVKGSATETSDTDILVILETHYPLNRELYSLWDKGTANFPSLKENRVSPHFVSLPTDISEAGGLWFECALDSVVLWEVDFTVTRFLSQIKKQCLESKIIRKISHGHPYWIHTSGEK